MNWYVLDEKKAVVGPVSVAHYHAWEQGTDGDPVARRDPMARRRVAVDEIGSWQVSTVFLGLDHRHFGEGPPIVFETMVFPASGQMIERASARYSTWAEAEQGHTEMVARVLRGELDTAARESRAS